MMPMRSASFATGGLLRCAHLEESGRRVLLAEGIRDHEGLDALAVLQILAQDAVASRLEGCGVLGAAGIPAGPCHTPAEVIADEHVERRNMLVEMDRVDGVDEPVLIPGNPVKLSGVAEGPETRVPWVGEHTEAVLRGELGIDDDTLEALRGDGVIN